jgi:hypothetical protein
LTLLSTLATVLVLEEDIGIESNTHTGAQTKLKHAPENTETRKQACTQTQIRVHADIIFST